MAKPQKAVVIVFRFSISFIGRYPWLTTIMIFHPVVLLIWGYLSALM